MKFVFICGLPGSGKSFLGKQLTKQASGEFLDDLCRTCGPKRLKDSFNSETVIVADPSLCRPMNRCFAEEMIKNHHPGSEIEWIYFENNPEQCWINIQQRDDGRKISKDFIERLSRVYITPENATIIKVWR